MSAEAQSAWGTRVDEVAEGVYRISTPVSPTVIPGGFTFNQYLVVDEAPLLFHTGHRALFPQVRAAIERVLPLERLRWVAFSHVEADECGAMNLFLAAAPNAQLVCSQTAAAVSVNDLADRPPRPLADGEVLSLGRKTVRWMDTPHLPHGWEAGYLFEERTRTLFCGDLFTQPGDRHGPRTTGDILTPSEAAREAFGYFSPTGGTARAKLERLAATEPQLLACMHGAAYAGDGAALLRGLADALEPRAA
jgi:flavorubredoxin